MVLGSARSSGGTKYAVTVLPLSEQSTSGWVIRSEDRPGDDGILPLVRVLGNDTVDIIEVSDVAP